jgi:hypothetical protein
VSINEFGVPAEMQKARVTEVIAKKIIRVVGLSLLLASSSYLTGQSTTPEQIAGLRTFAPVTLRGFGTVSGSFSEEAGGSVLTISCEDDSKAKLLQAKYLSDLVDLPGVARRPGTPSIYDVADQGFVVAYASGSQVMIITGTSDQALRALIQKVNPTGVTNPQVQVPMYLDRWDKFSFRHYYRIWTRPQGMTDANYNFTYEFDWANSEDRSGFLMADAPLQLDSAEGIMNYGYWDWMEYEAEKRKLPVDLHMSGGAGGDPNWLLNAYRDQVQQKMPGFTGNFHEMISPYLGGQGVLSWSATTGEDAKLGQLQDSVRRFGNLPNVVSFLEPHAELHHGVQDIFLEYGPVADAGYRQYLQGKYGTVAVLAKRWGVSLGSWDDVHLQELASFAGWGPGAVDVGGVWKVGYEKLKETEPNGYGYNARKALASEPAPDDWFNADFNDSSWPDVSGGGNDQELFLKKRPAVFRRTFDLPAGWAAKNPRVWIYVWDLNQANRADIRVAINGKTVGNSEVPAGGTHWCAMEVTGIVKDGPNSLAIRVPQGYLGYKIYLSPVEPKQYPNLGETLNAQWVDFSDFTQWSRIEDVRRGMEMIRQVSPNQGITLMHPDEYSDGVKSLAEAYGGEFHNTGYMGVFYADYNSSLMRGANLPYSLENAAPAADLKEFKKMFGLYQTEGVQAVDYFIHIGDILWHPDIKADYEAHRKQIELMGQSHMPKAQVACLYDDRGAQLTGFPWGSSQNTVMSGGYWAWNACSVLLGHYAYDGLSQSSFANKDADPYGVVIDTNTSIMDESMVNDIEKWIRNGGTFVTLAQTGRHTPEKFDAWPISRLTGYKVGKIDQLTPDGNVGESGTLQMATGQSIFGNAWNGVIANGLHLQKTADDTHDLLLWKDGTVAAGMRPLGKGFIVDLGAKFTGRKIPDRIDPGDKSPETRELRDLLTAVLQWRKINAEPAHLANTDDHVLLRHSVTNDGLYDAWTLWNRSDSQEQTATLVLDKSKATFAADIEDGKKLSLTNETLENIVLKPSDTRVFLTPIEQIAQAPAAWFELQRNWWRGTTAPRPKVLPGPSHRFSYDLSQDWKFKTLPAGSNATSMLAAKFDDTDWPSRELGIWDVKDAGGTGHGVFRKTFTVPAQWGEGLVSIWMLSWDGSSFVENGRVWLDGKEVKPMNNTGYIAIGLSTLQPGSTHTVAVEVESAGVLAGLRGESWLSFEPTAPAKIDLAGKWSPSADGLAYASPISLPGNYNTQFMKRTFTVDEKYRGQNAVLIVDADPALIAVLINGKLMRRHHHMIGTRGSLNLTPYIHFGGENEIQLVRWNGSGSGTVHQVFMGFYPANGYPQTGE